MTITDVEGFLASGVASGIKNNKELDLALITTEDQQPVPAAAVFTSNKMTAAPVLISRKHLEVTGVAWPVSQEVQARNLLNTGSPFT